MRVFKIHNRYNDGQCPLVSGHSIMAEGEMQALALAIQHEVSMPFGRKCVERVIAYSCTVEEMRKRSGGREIWFENDQGKLLPL